MSIEPAGERAERGHDHLCRGHDEAAARYMAAAQVHAQLRVEVAGDLRPRVVGTGFMTKDNSAELHLLRQPAAAVIGETRIVVADYPGPVEPSGNFGQQRAGVLREPVAAERSWKLSPRQ